MSGRQDVMETQNLLRDIEAASMELRFRLIGPDRLDERIRTALGETLDRIQTNVAELNKRATRIRPDDNRPPR